MSRLKMPKLDRRIIANKNEILQDLKKILKSENILFHDDEVKPNLQMSSKEFQMCSKLFCDLKHDLNTKATGVY